MHFSAAAEVDGLLALRPAPGAGAGGEDDRVGAADVRAQVVASRGRRAPGCAPSASRSATWSGLRISPRAVWPRCGEQSQEATGDLSVPSGDEDVHGSSLPGRLPGPAGVCTQPNAISTPPRIGSPRAPARAVPGGQVASGAEQLERERPEGATTSQNSVAKPKPEQERGERVVAPAGLLGGDEVDDERDRAGEGGEHAERVEVGSGSRTLRRRRAGSTPASR